LPAEKTARAQERRRQINRITRSSSRTLVKKAERLIGQEDTSATAAAVTNAISALDRAANKGVIHPNNAARRKSRLARKANKDIVAG
jgi:small subunit ribosomal protein S20